MNRYVSPLFREEYEKGIQEGIQQGVQQGLKEGKREKLMVLIELKYGEKGIELFPLVSKLDDIGVIDALSELVKLVDDYDQYKKKLVDFMKKES